MLIKRFAYSYRVTRITSRAISQGDGQGAGIPGCFEKDGVVLEYLNIGGGMGIIYKDEQPPDDAGFCRRGFAAPAENRFKDYHGAGSIYRRQRRHPGPRVLYMKDNGFKKFLIVDAGMNDLIRRRSTTRIHGSFRSLKLRS